MKITNIVILALLVLLLPLTGYAHKPHAAKLNGPYSVGGKHAKHNTYAYLGKNKRHKKASFHRSPVSGQIIPGEPVRR